MNYLKGLPTKNEKGVTVLVMDERTKENRSIDVRSEETDSSRGEFGCSNRSELKVP